MIKKSPLRSSVLLWGFALSSVISAQLFAQNSSLAFYLPVIRPLQVTSNNQADLVQSPQASDPALSKQVTLPLKWKYGWADGQRANTIGSAAVGDPLPKATYYLSSGYSPQQISIAYGFTNLPAGDTGAGKTIAVIESYGNTNIQSDLNMFDAQYGIPAATVHIAYPTGKPTSTDAGWAEETSMDVEWAHAMAPGATIWVIVAPDNTLDSLLTAVDYAVKTAKATIVSMSWGLDEFSTEKSYDSHFTNQLVTFIASAGDNQDTNWPSTSPYVLAVGGTTMTLDTNTSAIISETGWNGQYDLSITGPGEGGGGGFSKYEKQPQYQYGFTGFTNNVKTVPDVSYNADPYTGFAVYFTSPGSSSGGWVVTAGTSAGAPQWAAIVADCNWSTYKTGKINFIYDIYQFDFYLGATTDIVAGSNGVYPATAYYDLATGMGSPGVGIFGQYWSIGYGPSDIFY
jgi:subtilase family serine protease